MNPFLNHIQKFGSFSSDELALVETKLHKVKFSSSDYFLKAGQYSNRIGFIADGVFRIFFYDNEGNEIVRYFLAENQFLVNLHAYDNQVISSEYIQSLSESTVISIFKTDMLELGKQIPQWNDVINQIKQTALLEKLYNRSDLVSQDATTKYLDFMKKNPNLVNRIPLGHLASYLGIKQQSLSRIRKSMVL